MSEYYRKDLIHDTRIISESTSDIIHLIPDNVDIKIINSQMNNREIDINDPIIP